MTPSATVLALQLPGGIDQALGLDASLVDADNGVGWCQGNMHNKAQALAAFKKVGKKLGVI